MRDGHHGCAGQDAHMTNIHGHASAPTILPHTVAIIEVGFSKLVGIVLNRCMCDEFILPAGVPTSRINGRNSNVIADHVRQWCLLNT